MTLFLLKKNFCDGWDNFFYLLIPNLLCTLFIALSFLALSMLLGLETAFALPIFFLAFVILLGLLMILVMPFSENAALIADFQMPSISGYFKAIPGAAWDAFRYGALVGLILVAAVVGIPSYLSMGGILGNALSLLLAFFVAILLLSLQWFIPLRALLHDNFSKTLKKCFVIFFDNTAFSIFMFFYNLLLGIASFFILTIAPGSSGIVLSLVNALRLRLYKYDWLDANPQYKGAKSRKRIPWADLIKEDAETLGPRGFKSFFMPWKED